MSIDVDSGLLWLSFGRGVRVLVVAIYDMGEEEENDDDGMDEEEEEGKNDDDDMAPWRGRGVG